MNKPKILIVEDEQIIAIDLRMVLETLGYSASNIISKGEDVLPFVKENEIDLILMDIRLSGEMSGIDSARELYDNNYKIPVIYCSAEINKERLQKIKIPNTYGFLIKPIREDTLYTTIEIALDKAKLEREVLIKNQELERVNEEFERSNEELISSNTELEISKNNYKKLFENMYSGFAVHEVIFNDDNEPVDYVVTDINKSYERFTGLNREQVINKKIKDVLPNIEEDWVKTACKVAVTGKPVKMEMYSAPLDKYFDIYIYSTKKGQFISIFNDITEQKKSEERIKYNEKILSTIFNNNKDPQILWKVTPSNNLTMAAVNDAYINIMESYGLNISKSSFIDKPIQEVANLSGISKIILDYTLKKYQQVITTKEVVDYTIETDIKGEPYYSQYTLIPILNNSNNVDYILFKSYNLTERIKAEKEIRESEKRFKAVFENSNVGYSISNLEGRFIEVNKAICDILGYNREELLTKKFVDITHPDDIEISVKRWKKAQQEKESFYEINKRFEDKAGKTIYVKLKVSLIYDDQNHLLYNICEIINLTEQKEYKELLEEKDITINLQNSIIDSIQQAIIVTSLNGKVTYWNPYAEKLYGWKKEDVLGNNILDFTPSEDMAEEGANIMKEISKGNPWSGKFKLKNSKGEVFVGIVTDSPLYNEKGELSGIIGITTDITEELEIQKKLKESEEKYRFITENSFDMIALQNIDGSISYISPSAYRITGYTPEELIQMPAFGYAHPEDKIILEKALSKLLTTEEFLDIEFREIKKNGDVLWLESRIRAIKNDSGEIISVIATSYEITERKMMEIELKKSEERYRLISESYTEGVSLSENGEIKFLSDGYSNIIGYTKKEISDLGINGILSLVHKDDIKKINEITMDAVKKKIENIKYQFRIKNKSGKYIWLEDYVNIKYDKDGNRYQTIIHSRDITDIKKLEQEIKNIQEIVESLIDTTQLITSNNTFIHVAKKIFDLCKKFTKADSGYIALLSKNGKENDVLYLDSGPDECKVDPELPMPIRGLRKVAYDTKSAIYDNDFYNNEWYKYIPEGHVRLNSVIFAPLIINDKAVGLIGLSNKEGGFNEYDKKIVDIFGKIASIALYTSRTLELLNKQSYELIQSNKELSTFAHRVAHDLKNPIISVISGLKLLNDYELDEDEKNDIINNMNKKSDKLLIYIDSILKYSKIEKDKSNFKNINIRNIINNVINNLENIIKEKKVKIESNIDAEIYCDESLIFSLFSNLITNSIKYSKENTEIIISEEDNEDDYLFSVKDNGIGIKEKNMDKIFEMMYREPSIKKMHDGAGIGLASCKKIIELHGGRIWVESELSKGSTFYFTIPKNNGVVKND